MEDFSFMQESATGTTISLFVQPRAGKTGIAGIHDGNLKLRLAAPPVDGEANRECILFFAKFLKIPKSDIAILHGDKSRRKTLAIRGLSPEDIRKALVAATAGGGV